MGPMSTPMLCSTASPLSGKRRGVTAPIRPCHRFPSAQRFRPEPLPAWRAVLLCLGLVLTAAGAAGAAQNEQDAYLHELQARAAALELATSRTWRALLHYEADWLGPGVTSTVASPWFFRAAAGRTDPAAELAATLAAFFLRDDMAPRQAPPQCVFRARYAWLDARLDFDPARMPVLECDQYQHWRGNIDAAGVSLVFPAAFTNSPASMFGHTLIRIDSAGGERDRELLAYAVNFAASTDKQQGLVFAYKGLFGGYPGIYGIFPYYEKVKQYAWIENRDVWDYRVKLDAAEIDRLVAHLWELQGVAFDYYFLLKNCAYQLLALLEVARPSLRLVERFDWYAIPADTIRALRSVPGLLGPPEYRPSLATILETHYRALAPQQQALALALALARGKAGPNGPALTSVPPQARARVLEVGHDYLYYRVVTDRVARETALPRLRDILLARSRIPVDSKLPAPPVPAVAPDAGHPTLRVAATGVWAAEGFSIGFKIRPAYHDLLDPPGGYTAGAQIEFLDLGLRLDPGDGGLELDYFTLIDIVSIAPRTALFQPISWRLATGLRQRPVAAPFAEDAHLGAFLEGGPGLAWGDLDGVTLYSFALGSLDANHGFDHGYAAGAGASVGLLAYPARGWQLQLEAGALDYLAGDEGHRVWLSLAQQWPLAGHLALRLELGWEGTARADSARGILGVRAYF